MREELDIPMAIQGSQIYPGEHYNKIQTALKQSTVREERHSKELRSSETQIGLPRGSSGKEPACQYRRH